MTLRERMEKNVQLLRDQARLRRDTADSPVPLSLYQEGLSRGESLALELAARWLEADLRLHDAQQAALGQEQTSRGLFRRTLGLLREMVAEGEARRGHS